MNILMAILLFGAPIAAVVMCCLILSGRLDDMADKIRRNRK